MKGRRKQDSAKRVRPMSSKYLVGGMIKEYVIRMKKRKKKRCPRELSY